MKSRLVKTNRVNKLTKKASVPALSDYYDIYNCSYNDLGIQMVDVNKILGMTSPKNQEFNPDFSPINPTDPDWLSKKQLVESGGQLEPVALVLTTSGDYFYYGNGTGANTISVAKTMNVSTMQAQVLELVVNKVANKQTRLKKLARVPTLRDFYVPYEYDYIDIGQQVVDVSKIIGISNGRNDDYNSDFTPIDENDTRWHYQKDLVESGGKMEPIPLIKMVDGNYIGNGDGSHRISVAKVLGLDYVDAIVSVMVPSDEGIEEEWEKYSKEKIDKLNEMSEQYKQMKKELISIEEEYFGTEKYENLIQEIEILGNEISELDWEILDEEKKFKQEIVQKYLN